MHGISSFNSVAREKEGGATAQPPRVQVAFESMVLGWQERIDEVDKPARKLISFLSMAGSIVG
jgi:hypothetical protein